MRFSGRIFLFGLWKFSDKGKRHLCQSAGAEHMKENYFIELGPDQLLEGGENHHLILAQYDPETEKYSFPSKTLTCCGRYNRDKSIALPIEQLILPEEMEDDGSYDEDAYRDYARLFLAERQNDGVPMCASCVARLYSSDSQAHPGADTED
jgi:hypothetical protein